MKSKYGDMERIKSILARRKNPQNPEFIRILLLNDEFLFVYKMTVIPNLDVHFHYVRGNQKHYCSDRNVRTHCEKLS